MVSNVTANACDVTVVNRLMSEEHFTGMWLHVLLLFLVMGIGVPGNCVVIAVFFKSQRRRRYNSTQLLVLALALTDLAVCLFLLPFDLYRLRHFYSLRSQPMCDLFEYFRNTTISLSCFLLTSTAVERYRAICNFTVLGGQGRRGTVLIIVVLLVCSLVLSSPTSIFLGIQDRTVPPLLVTHFSVKVQKAYAQSSGHALMFSCEYLDTHDHTLGLRLFGLSSLFIFLALIVVSIGSYGKIYHKIKKNQVSMHTALNKVAPMPAARATRHIEDRDGCANATQPLHQSKPRHLNIQRSCQPRAPIGIFTITTDREGSSWQSRPLTSRPDGHGVLGSRSNVFQRTMILQEGSSGNHKKSPPDIKRRLSPEIVEMPVFSDENDIDVTVENKDDAVSDGRNERSETVLADVLNELQSVNEDHDFMCTGSEGGTVHPCTTTVSRDCTNGAVISPDQRQSQTGGSPRTDEDNIQRCTQPNSQHQTVFAASQPNYDIFVVCGDHSESVSSRPSEEHISCGNRRKKKCQEGIFRNDHSHDSSGRTLMCDIDFLAMNSSGMDKTRPESVRRTPSGSAISGPGDKSDSECDIATSCYQISRNSSRLVRSSSHGCGKRVASKITANGNIHATSTVLEDCGEPAASILTQNRDKDPISMISQGSDKRVTATKTCMSGEDPGDKWRNRSFALKPELCSSHQKLSSDNMSSSCVVLPSAHPLRATSSQLECPDQGEPCTNEQRSTTSSSLTPVDVSLHTLTKQTSSNKLSASTQCRSEHCTRVSSVDKVSLCSGPLTPVDSKSSDCATTPANQETFPGIQRQADHNKSTVENEHQRPRTLNKQQMAVLIQTSHNLKEQTSEEAQNLHNLNRQKSLITQNCHDSDKQKTSARPQNLNSLNKSTTSFRAQKSHNFNTRAASIKALNHSKLSKHSVSASVHNSHSTRFARQIRVAKILLIVTGTFLMSFLPFWVLTVVYMVWPHLDWQLSMQHRMFMSVLYQSYFINNAINPILFAFYSPEFRSECLVLLKDLKKKLCG